MLAQRAASVDATAVTGIRAPRLRGPPDSGGHGDVDGRRLSEFKRRKHATQRDATRPIEGKIKKSAAGFHDQNARTSARSELIPGRSWLECVTPVSATPANDRFDVAHTASRAP